MSEFIADRENIWPYGSQREEIVRCGDCAFYSVDELGNYCTLLDFEDVKDMADKFCAWGKRKVVTP